MRSKRANLTENDYRLMELVMLNFKAAGLRKLMNDAITKHYKEMSNRGVK